jgi:hypothetical protein
MVLLKALKALYNIGRGGYELTHPDESAKTYFFTEFYKKQISEIEDCVRDNGYKDDFDTISKEQFLEGYNKSTVFIEMAMWVSMKDGLQKDKKMQAIHFACKDHIAELEQMHKDGVAGKISYREYNEKQAYYYGEFLYSIHKTDNKFWWSL